MEPKQKLSPRDLVLARKAKLDAIMGARLRDISATQLQELLLILGPVILLVLGALWLASRFIEPAPPTKIAITTAGETGGYFATGKKYAAILKTSGITLDVKTSSGSPENVKRLLDPKSGVQVALLQGGTTNSEANPDIMSLGRVYLEPMWVFYRGNATWDRLLDLKGRRLIVGPDGSGTRALALALLAANGITADNTTFLPLTGAKAIETLTAGEADAAFFVSSPSSPQVQTLLRHKDLKIMSLSHAEAYTRRFPYLNRIVLPKGAIDLVENVPAADVEMVAPVAALVAKTDLHPALINLLVDAAKAVHTPGGLFHRVGEFPRAQDPEFEMSEDAERAHKTGPNWLKRTLPFWLATFIERAIVVAVPVAGVLLPLIKLGPALYKWRVRRRLFYWYGRLKALDSTVTDDGNGDTLDAQRQELAVIDEAVANVPIPLGYSDQYYSLRAAIDLVRQRLANRAIASASTIG
ncbi:MAG: TAXI family TRAP transporter solute-binding subunit [Hyphomicrobiaceae bacterium]